MKPAPARLPEHLEQPIIAALREVTLKANAAESALRGGRVAHAGVWVGELVQAAGRLERAWAAAHRTQDDGGRF